MMTMRNSKKGQVGERHNYVDRKVCVEGSECVGVVEKEEIDVGREAGIRVVEVENLKEALGYMLK